MGGCRNALTEREVGEDGHGNRGRIAVADESSGSGSFGIRGGLGKRKMRHDGGAAGQKKMAWGGAAGFVART